MGRVARLALCLLQEHGMAFTSTNQFGITVANMKTRYMAWLKTADDGVLENAIDVTSADVCRLLMAIGILPSSVTSVSFPDDFVNMGQLVAMGSLAQYALGTASNREQGIRWTEQYRDRLREVRANPAEFLQAYSQIDGVNTVRSHTEGLSQSDLQASRGLFWSPLNRIGSWTR
jgi:hypothetical protein